MAREDLRSGEDVRDDVMSAPDGPEVRKDRRVHGGAPLHPDDDALAERTEQERVDAGLADYDPATVPDATDDPVPVDIRETAEYEAEKEEIDDEVDRGDLPSGQRPDFPPSSYPNR
jgi:hypothetical protein